MEKEHNLTEYSFSGKIWKHKGPAGWYFVTLPLNLSKKIRKAHMISEEGWGRLKATATIKETTWKTSIWYDTKAVAYLLPIKAVIRKKEDLAEDSRVKVELGLDNWNWDTDL